MSAGDCWMTGTLIPGDVQGGVKRESKDKGGGSKKTQRTHQAGRDREDIKQKNLQFGKFRNRFDQKREIDSASIVIYNTALSIRLSSGLQGHACVNYIYILPRYKEPTHNNQAALSPSLKC